MSKLDGIKERLSKIDPNMKVFKCNYEDQDSACGIYEGQYLDASHDECHHTLGLDLAEYIVNTPKDIEYLLSRLEIAEKALNDVIFETDVPVSDVPLIKRLCTEALQQLRS